MSGERIWRQRARWLAWRVNFGWWLHYFLPVLFSLSVLSAGILLALRARGEVPFLFWFLLIASFFVSAIGSFFASRRKFFSMEDALTRLDINLNLDTTLTAAAADQVEWPKHDKEERSALRYLHARIFLPVLMSMLVLVLAGFIPVQSVEQLAEFTPEEPLAWKQVETWLDDIEEEEIVEDEAIEEFRDQLEELRSVPPENWYDHSVLEGGESLRDKVESAMRHLENQLEKLDQSVEPFEEGAQELSPEEYANAQKGLEGMLGDLELGDLPMKRELREELGKLGRNSERKLSEEEAKKLREKFKKGMENLKRSLEGDQQSSDGSDGAGNEKKGQSTEKHGKGQQGKSGQNGEGGQEGSAGEEGQQGQDGSGSSGSQQEGGQGGHSSQGNPPQSNAPGQGGGISRDPGTAPLEFGDLSRFHGSDNIEGLAGDAPLRGNPGETLGFTATSPAVDRLKSGSQNAGEITSRGEGGDVVWQQRILPEEEAVLKEFFE